MDGSAFVFLLAVIACLVVWLAAGFTAAAWTFGGLLMAAVLMLIGKAVLS